MTVTVVGASDTTVFVVKFKVVSRLTGFVPTAFIRTFSVLFPVRSAGSVELYVVLGERVASMVAALYPTTVFSVSFACTVGAVGVIGVVTIAVPQLHVDVVEPEPHVDVPVISASVDNESNMVSKLPPILNASTLG